MIVVHENCSGLVVIAFVVIVVACTYVERTKGINQMRAHAQLVDSQ